MQDIPDKTSSQIDGNQLFSNEPTFAVRRRTVKPGVAKESANYSLERARLEAQEQIAKYRKADLQHGDGTVGGMQLNSAREGGPLIDRLGKPARSANKTAASPTIPSLSNNTPQLSTPPGLTPIKRPEL